VATRALLQSHPVADAVCFDLLTFFDEDERGAWELRKTLNLICRTNSHYLRPQIQFSATRIFMSIRFKELRKIWIRCSQSGLVVKLLFS
jgi:hypothetical protein